MSSGYKELLERINELEDMIGYVFRNKENVMLALTHSSYANENRNEGLKYNERLEFLGDAVLNIVTSEAIYSGYPDLSEGEMTKVRANIVCEPSLAKCANSIRLGEYLLLGKGEKQTGGHMRNSILCDAFEALIGAIYIDSGIKNSKAFIHRQMGQLIHDSVKGMVFMDFKTQLQEIVQKNGDKKISYEIVEEKGPDHNKTFVVQVRVCDIVKGVGEGKSKKEAEQNAAKAALSDRQLQ